MCWWMPRTIRLNIPLSWSKTVMLWPKTISSWRVYNVFIMENTLNLLHSRKFVALTKSSTSFIGTSQQHSPSYENKNLMNLHITSFNNKLEYFCQVGPLKVDMRWQHGALRIIEKSSHVFIQENTPLCFKIFICSFVSAISHGAHNFQSDTTQFYKLQHQFLTCVTFPCKRHIISERKTCLCENNHVTSLKQLLIQDQKGYQHLLQSFSHGNTISSIILILRSLIDRL